MLLASLLFAATVPVVHVHSAGEAGFRANAYLVEAERGVVAIDAPFTVSEARAFRAKLEALKKPLLAVLVTHAHPDHVNGITALVEGRNVPVVALGSVDATLRAIDGPKRSYWTPIYKEEYPVKTTFPSRLVSGGDSVTYGGLTFKAVDLGAGESESQTLWILEGVRKAAFVGDLVIHRMHGWLAEGRTAAWLRALERAGDDLAGVEVLYPGHGPSGGPELLAWQRAYLETYRAAVKELAVDKPALTEADKARLTARMEEFLPKAPLATLVGFSADAVAAEIIAAH